MNIRRTQLFPATRSINASSQSRKCCPRSLPLFFFFVWLFTDLDYFSTRDTSSSARFLLPRILSINQYFFVSAKKEKHSAQKPFRDIFWSVRSLTSLEKQVTLRITELHYLTDIVSNVVELSFRTKCLQQEPDPSRRSEAVRSIYFDK